LQGASFALLHTCSRKEIETFEKTGDWRCCIKNGSQEADKNLLVDGTLAFFYLWVPRQHFVDPKHTDALKELHGWPHLSERRGKGACVSGVEGVDH
jgi:hypothetical protein